MVSPQKGQIYIAWKFNLFRLTYSNLAVYFDST